MKNHKQLWLKEHTNGYPKNGHNHRNRLIMLIHGHHKRKFLLKKPHKTPNNIGPKGSQQHGGHFKWTWSTNTE